MNKNVQSMEKFLKRVKELCLFKKIVSIMPIENAQKSDKCLVIQSFMLYIQQDFQ
jgi:hypothetical protein